MLKRLIIYMLIGTVITVSPLYYVNNVLLSDTNVIIEEKSGKILPISASLNVKVPAEAKNISLLYDRKNLIYLNSGNLYIKNIEKDTILSTVVENTPVLYARPLDDRDIIMYFTYDQNKLEIKTFDVNKGEKTQQKSITVKNFYQIKNLKYSSLTNLIYINVVINENQVFKDKVYRVDIMKDISLYTVNKEISQLELLNSKDTVVYQNVLNNVYIKGKQFEYENYKEFKLLGVDKNDSIYLLALNNKGTVIAVKNGSIQKLQQLDNINFTDIINRDNKIYLIYKDYILDLIDNKKIKISPDVKIVDINKSSILLENTKNEITFEKM